jgi:peptidoglycan hydrolase-like protein with peptidoglycan-binding domain
LPDYTSKATKLKQANTDVLKTTSVNLPVLKNGSSGAHVRTLQMLLNGNGYSSGTVDGDFGPNTEKAVRAFQKAKNLIQDGLVGQNTWTAILGV